VIGTLGTATLATAPNNEPLGELMIIQNNSLLTKTQVEGKSELLIEIETVARNNGISEQRFLSLIKCESSLNKEAIGDSGRAYGLLQFHKPTFKQYCEGNYYNYLDQLQCGASMIKSGLSYHWTCRY
jgi:hypothetical protein